MLALGIEIKSSTDSVRHQIPLDALWEDALSALRAMREVPGGLTGAQRTISSFATMNLFREGSCACGISSKNKVFAAQSNCL